MKQETKEQLRMAWKTGMLYRFYAWLSKHKKMKKHAQNQPESKQEALELFGQEEK